MAGEYVCTLDEASLKKAKEELNEDPRERLGQVETLRQWLVQQPHLSCPTDTPFLLRFLRGAKFSQLRARTVLENYLKARTDMPDWMVDVDMANPNYSNFFKTTYFVHLPRRDKDGRRILLMRPGYLDPSTKEFSKGDMFKAMMGYFNYLLHDEAVQVNGLVYLLDLTGFELKHQLYWGMDDLRKSTKMWQDSVPARFKGFHYYNMNSVFEAFLQLFLPLLKKKFRDRVFLHGNNMESVYKVVPMELLPVEYLPDDYKGPNAGTTQQLVDDLIKTLTSPEVRGAVLAESDKKYGLDESKRVSDVPQASFRKLNID